MVAAVAVLGVAVAVFGDGTRWGAESFALPMPTRSSPRRRGGGGFAVPFSGGRAHSAAPSSSFVLTGTANDDDDDDDDREASPSFSSYDDSDGAVSKGIVGSLTDLVNTVSAARDREETDAATSAGAGSSSSSSSSSSAPPKTPEELLDRIRSDYTKRNYLWTGDLDLACFFEDCTFTDPTISFVGTDKFTENTQNLVPIVEAVAEGYRSDLLSIELGRGGGGGGGDAPSGAQDEDDEAVYVETRWNMVGSLTASPWLFWKPKIDVIGRTKFWFRKVEEVEDGGGGNEPSSSAGYRVYFYDESWEVPAWKALLQIVTPAGTVSGTSAP